MPAVAIELKPARPMRCSAVAFLYECDAEFVWKGPQCVEIIEPLPVDIPGDARPYCYGLGEIDFYSKNGNILLAKGVRCHDLERCGRPIMLRVRGTDQWFEMAGGSCVFHRGQWCMIWHAYRNARPARDLNGVEDGEYGIRPRRSTWFRAWCGRVCRRIGERLRR